MKSKNFLWFIVGFSVTVSAAVLARLEPWNAINNPDLLEVGLNKNFLQLPKQGTVAKRPWSDTYWPSQKSGLGWRWYNGTNGVNESQESVYHGVYAGRSLLRMSREELARLSPIEKFDIYLGNSEQYRSGFYQWYSWERARTINSGKRIESWEGICNGWAVASINHPEPKAIQATVQVKDSDGQMKPVVIPFHSADIKALMSLYYYYLTMSAGPDKLHIVGGRCDGLYVEKKYNDGRRIRSYLDIQSECKDINAGTFHIAIANQIGVQQESFVMDVDPGPEVWNHPITAFRSQYLEVRDPSRGASREATREVVVETTIHYMAETNPYAFAHRGVWDWNNAQEGRVYQYTVELNAANQVVGGAWITRDHPDFLWRMEKQPFEGDFKHLDQLVIPAR